MENIVQIFIWQHKRFNLDYHPLFFLRMKWTPMAWITKCSTPNKINLQMKVFDNEKNKQNLEHSMHWKSEKKWIRFPFESEYKWLLSIQLVSLFSSNLLFVSLKISCSDKNTGNDNILHFLFFQRYTHIFHII